MNNKPNKGSTEGLQVSAYVTPQMRETLRSLGNGNISQGIRVAVSEPRQSPSGADWITSPAQLPDPASCIGPNVLATPVGVLAHGIAPTNLVLDMEAGELSFLTTGSGVTSELTLANLALLAGRLGGAVIACCDPGADERGQTVGGIKVSRLGHGLIELAPAGTHGADCAVALPIRQGLQLCAEIAGLLARRVAQHQQAITELNASLAEPVEAPQ